MPVLLTSRGSFPCGELVLALVGMAAWIHLLGPGWGHLASSHDASFRERFSVKFIGFNPIICGVEICYISAGGSPQGPPYVFNEAVPWIQLFFIHWEIGILIPRIQKISLLSFKLWIWESKKVFNWESEMWFSPKIVRKYKGFFDQRF